MKIALEQLLETTNTPTGLFHASLVKPWNVRLTPFGNVGRRVLANQTTMGMRTLTVTTSIFLERLMRCSLPVEKPRQQWRNGQARQIIGDFDFLELQDDQ